MLAKLMTAACIVSVAVLPTAAAASPTQRVRPVHFAGVPAVGVKASTPTAGSLLVGVRSWPTHGTDTDWNVYADGRIIWQKWTPPGDATVVPTGARRLDTGYVQERLTPAGVQLLRSRILATGLFDHNLRLALGKGHPQVSEQVRSGDRMVTLEGVPSPDPSWKEQFTPATPEQTSALAGIAALVADPAGLLPASVWANPQIRAFVPSHYLVAFDRGYPDISKLPARAGKALSHYKPLKQHSCQILTTAQARALLQAFAAAGISPADNHAENIGFDFAGLSLPHPSYLHFSPGLPDARC
jgi:hypothetical protein